MKILFVKRCEGWVGKRVPCQGRITHPHQTYTDLLIITQVLDFKVIKILLRNAKGRTRKLG